MQKKIIAVVGATATGKTAKAIQLAQQYNTEILSFDSRQCFTELTIGVAKPTTEELAQVPHHFINSHSIHQAVNAGEYERYALVIIEKLFKTYNTIIAVGGTGLYLTALEKGLNEMPAIPTTLRNELVETYNKKGIEWLKGMVLQHDTSFTNANDLNNSQRMLRALEMVLHTGKSIKYFQTKEVAKRAFTIEKMGIDIERNRLYDRINKRVDAMIAAGLVEEAKGLYQHRLLNALQTVGYTELFDYFDKKNDLPTAIALIKQHTRNYAKRQMTWFKKDKSIVWQNNEMPNN